MNTKSYTALYRILHWAIALSFLLLLFTVFLRLTWMNKYVMAESMGDYLKNNTDLYLSNDQLIVMAKKIRNNMWDWHYYLGYVLTGLFSIRLSLPLFGFVKFQPPLEANLSKIMRFQRWLYIMFYICFVIVLTTGFILLFGSKEIMGRSIIKFLHVYSLYFFVPFVVLHVGGVLYSEFTNNKGIISRIISGSRHQEKKR